MWPNSQYPADLGAFTEDILNAKLHFLCSVYYIFQFLVINLSLCYYYRKTGTVFTDSLTYTWRLNLGTPNFSLHRPFPDVNYYFLSWLTVRSPAALERGWVPKPIISTVLLKPLPSDSQFNILSQGAKLPIFIYLLACLYTRC